MVNKVPLRSGDRRMAQVMVEVDILEGLPKSFVINWGDITFNQRSDYKEIPFHYLICHYTGHVKNECHSGTSHSYGKKWWQSISNVVYPKSP